MACTAVKRYIEDWKKQHEKHTVIFALIPIGCQLIDKSGLVL